MKLQRLAAIAAKEAVKSKHQYKLGAVIYKQGKVISRGYNDTKRGFSGYRGYWEGSLHAEISALIRARSDVRGCSILVFRVGGGDSRPCHSCMAALKAAGIKNVVYAHIGEFVKEKI